MFKRIQFLELDIIAVGVEPDRTADLYAVRFVSSRFDSVHRSADRGYPQRTANY